MFVFLNFNIFINLHFAHTLRFPSQLSYFCTDPQATVTQEQYPSLSKSHLQYFVRTGCCSSINFPLLIYSIIQCKCHQEKHDLSLLRQQVCRIPIFFSLYQARETSWDCPGSETGSLLQLSYFWHPADAVHGIPINIHRQEVAHYLT